MSTESHLEQAERHVSENAERIARQKEIIEQLQKAGTDEVVAAAKVLLKNLEDAHRIALDNLEIERRESDQSSN